MYLILLFIRLINYYTSLWHQCPPACVSKCCFLVLNVAIFESNYCLSWILTIPMKTKGEHRRREVIFNGTGHIHLLSACKLGCFKEERQVNKWVRKDSKTSWPSETEWAGMFCQQLVCQGEGYTLACMSTPPHTLSSPSLASPRAPLCWLGSNTKVSHPTGWAGGLVAPVSYSCGVDLGSTSLVFFCLIHPPLARSGFSSPLSPLWDPVADEPVLQLSGSCIVFNIHTHTHTHSSNGFTYKLACVSLWPHVLRSPSYTSTICSISSL